MVSCHSDNEHKCKASYHEYDRVGQDRPTVGPQAFVSRSVLMLKICVIQLIEVLAVKVDDPYGQDNDGGYHDVKGDVVDDLEG